MARMSKEEQQKLIADTIGHNQPTPTRQESRAAASTMHAMDSGTPIVRRAAEQVATDNSN